MTEKQNIIDGVDVNECEFFYNGYCGSEDCINHTCENNDNCLHKQLKRLQSELEAKEKEIQVLKQYKGSKQASYETMQKKWNEAEVKNIKLQQENSKLVNLLQKAKEGAQAYEYCIKNLEKDYETLQNQYNAVVEQNRQLQRELKEVK